MVIIRISHHVVQMIFCCCYTYNINSVRCTVHYKCEWSISFILVCLLYVCVCVFQCLLVEEEKKRQELDIDTLNTKVRMLQADYQGCGKGKYWDGSCFVFDCCFMVN